MHQRTYIRGWRWYEVGTRCRFCVEEEQKRCSLSSRRYIQYKRENRHVWNMHFYYYLWAGRKFSFLHTTRHKRSSLWWNVVCCSEEWSSSKKKRLQKIYSKFCTEVKIAGIEEGKYIKMPSDENFKVEWGGGEFSSSRKEVSNFSRNEGVHNE